MAKVIMFQGTASGVGKSTLVTGICRILKQDGLSVAPFKAQNMSSNAHYFSDGRQMARSQAVAAYACGITPDPDMNPLLLKPADLYGSEIILGGKSIGYMKDYAYNTLKTKILNEVMLAYQRLAKKYDVIVVEGAGSPVELNLKENDIVNMGFASRINCPVILVTDISRGGAFASTYGTIMLLEEKERELVKGTIINKFQGLPEYFESGTEIMQNITGKPVFGVVPHTTINIEDEDSLTDDGKMKTEESISRMLKGKLYQEYMNDEFDKLAEVLRQNLDMKAIYDTMGGCK